MLARIWQMLRNALAPYSPGKQAWQGAGWGVLSLLAVFTIIWAVVLMNVTVPNWGELAGLAANLSLSALAGWLVMLLAKTLFRDSPRLFTWALASTLMVVYPAWNLLFINGGALFVILSLAVFSLLGASVHTLLRAKRLSFTHEQRSAALAGFALGIILLGTGIFWMIYPGSPMPSSPVSSSATLASPLNLPDPSQPGIFPIKTLAYGSGIDLRRPQYGAQADLITQPVDGSAFIDGWDGWGGRLRSAYWGFDPAHLPLNALVWYPDAEGSFPLVIIVHGNHRMEDASETGYAYLGELLASRGFIVASIDENFLNAAPAIDYLGPVPTGLTRSHDARAWLILEHLRAWRGWNNTPGNPFYGKVNLDQVALIGHSRGGNAVAVAAQFNQLPVYPENAAVSFDYHFGIRTVIAIAPTERAAFPAGRPPILQNVDYLVLQGSHDAEIISFDGAQQFARIQFSGSDYHFKSSVVIPGANHSRFNTAWGLTDNSPIYAPFYNTAQLLSPQDQQQIASVFISAFLQASIYGETAYLSLLNGAAPLSQEYLPNAVILTQFVDSTTHYLATFEEDSDLTSATLNTAWVHGENLAAWKELLVPRTQGNQGTYAVFLGWDSPQARYVVHLPQPGLEITSQTRLVFSLADARSPQNDLQPLDFHIEIADEHGSTAQLPLLAAGTLQPPLIVYRYKPALIIETPTHEPVFQTFSLPVAAFLQVNPALDLSTLSALRFCFDLTPKGALYLDNVGFTD